MDEFIGFILLIIAISVIDRVMKAFKAGKRMPTPPVDAEAEEEPLFLERDVEIEQLEGGEGRLDSDLERLIAEELGLRPRRREPAEPSTAPREPPPRLRPAGEGRGGTLQRSAPSRPPPVPVGPRRTVVLPTPRPELETGVGPDRVPRPIERRVPQRPRTERRPAVEEVELVAPAPARARAKHRPVRRSVAPRVRHQGPARLPDLPGWTQMQKAIVWAEIVGPPRGLSE